MARLLLFVLSLTVALALAPPAEANPDPVTVTVTITRFVETDDPDEGILVDSPGDYYARVSIDGFLFPDTSHVDNVAEISPNWTFSRTVDSSQINVPVVIEIWDHDDTSADDTIDISPAPADRPLDLSVELSTGIFRGDINGVLMGESEGTEDDRGRVFFTISTSVSGDTDGDGIPDGAELFGFRDASGTVFTDMAALGADPCRKTIALEIDYMSGAADHTHQPQAAAVADAIAAFDAAPVNGVVPCPYPGFPRSPSGINLVIDISTSIPEQATFPLSSLAATRDAGNFTPGRRPFFHYVLFVHDQAAGNSSSGICCVDDRDFLVSLGSWANQVGTFRDQSGTILHELGHSLGLDHGGDEVRNYKPNYLSVMNYFFDPTGIPDPTIPASIDTNGDGTPDQSYRLDYSRADLPDLVKDALDEGAGIGDGTDFTFWFDPGYTKRSAQGNAAIDWDWDGTFPEAPVMADLNAEPCVSAGGNGMIDSTLGDDDRVIGTGAGPIVVAGGDFVCDTASSGDDTPDLAVGTNVVSNASLKTLHGWDDWQNLTYRAALSAGAGRPSVNHGPDMRFEDAEAFRATIFALFGPDLALTKAVDLVNANPGDKLTYTVTAQNLGTGAAKSVQIADTLPNGAIESWSLGVLVPGQSRSETFTFPVPCTTADLARLVNAAIVSGTNLLNNPEVNTTNNASTSSTTVHAPVMTVSKTATSSVNAGEAITYRITHENTGSGEAKSVVITDALPDDVYYSEALDQGAGPKPSSVTPNADGTTTLTWNVGDVAGGSGPMTIEYTARPSLLFVAGSSVANGARLTFTNANGCTYAPVTASQPTSLTATPPTRDPRGLGFWRNHHELWTTEILARIQATDDRFDGADGSAPDGRLSPTEVEPALAPGGNMDKVLEEELLATYFNLATRRINAGTAIASRAAERLGLRSVRDAAVFARDTLLLPVTPSSRDRYSDATRVLDEINANQSEVYG